MRSMSQARPGAILKTPALSLRDEAGEDFMLVYGHTLAFLCYGLGAKLTYWSVLSFSQ